MLAMQDDVYKHQSKDHLQALQVQAVVYVSAELYLLIDSDCLVCIYV